MEHNIGIIGLGNMGKEIAMRLSAKYEVYGYDVSDINKAEVEEKGVIFSALKELVSKSKYIFLSLPNAKISKSTCKEIISYISPESIVIETSTVLPHDVKELEMILSERNVKVVDAAILGGVKHVKEGRASFSVGGDENAISEITDFLLTLGKEVNMIGELGTGMAAKVINNGIAHNVMVLIMEAASIGRKLGIEPDKIFGILKGETTFDRPLNYRYKELVQQHKYEGGMSTLNAQKDSTLILELAQQLKVPIFTIQASQTVYDIAVNEDLGHLDYASIATLWEKWCEISFLDEKGVK